VVIARKSGDPDLEVAVTNTLEQKSTFNALGATSGAVAQVEARRGVHASGRVNQGFLLHDHKHLPAAVNCA
jgi:hypothetical protein